MVSVIEFWVGVAERRCGLPWRFESGKQMEGGLDPCSLIWKGNPERERERERERKKRERGVMEKGGGLVTRQNILYWTTSHAGHTHTNIHTHTHTHTN